MRVPRIDGARRVTDEADLHARIGIHDQIFAIQRPANLLIGTFFPGNRSAIDDSESAIPHLTIMPQSAKRGLVDFRRFCENSDLSLFCPARNSTV